MGIDNTLTVFGRFSGNPDLEYTMQQPDYDSEANLPKAYWNIEFFKRIKSVIYTKLYEAVRRLLTTNPNINCYFRVIANQNELNNLKDLTNYPITVGVNYTVDNWHDTGNVGRSQCTYQTSQILLRELLDNAYLTDEIQLGRQKDFQNLIYKPDYGTENDVDNFRNRYEETMALLNFAYAGWNQGEYARLLDIVLITYNYQIMAKRPLNKQAFFEEVNTIFHVKRNEMISKGEIKTGSKIKIHNFNNNEIKPMD
ncbi:522_t:CDS:1 [Cetraspora pellucida]|uniref:522_t:CDS:1 n=1 Tax=Cetraspora pellucida TaxID=1433469 RepID=A0A9N9FNR5_9GLOM|nr:522_t:CDS:1 [Cetraspora pellucida]